MMEGCGKFVKISEDYFYYCGDLNIYYCDECEVKKGCGKYVGDTPDLDKQNHLHKCGEMCCRENERIFCEDCKKELKKQTGKELLE